MSVVKAIGTVENAARSVNAALAVGQSSRGLTKKAATIQSDARKRVKEIAKWLNMISELLVSNEPHLVDEAKVRGEFWEWENALVKIQARCTQMNKPRRALVRLRKGFQEWRHVEDVKDEVDNLAKKVKKWHQNFATSLVKTEKKEVDNTTDVLPVTATVLKPSKDQKEAFDRMAGQLERLVQKTSPSSALSPSSERTKPNGTKKKREDPQVSAQETDYLRSKVNALKKLQPNLPQDKHILREAFESNSPETWRSKTHFPKTGDASDERQETVMETIRIVALFQSGKDIPFIEAAADLLKLSIALSDLGVRDEALAMNDWAVQIYRQLAKELPDQFRPHLATALSNLGISLHKCGRRKDALEAAQESIVIHRELGEKQPGAFLVDLAVSLNNLPVYLHGLDQWELALDAARGSVEIHRKLTLERPKEFKPHLASSLTNLSIYLRGLGEEEEALKAGDEAINIYRQLIVKRPKIFTPDLALSLHNISRSFAEAGKKKEALVTGRESVAIYRELAEERPDVFRPDLASSLSNFASYQQVIGNSKKALTVMRESVAIHRELAAGRPDVFNPHLATSLHNLLYCLDATPGKQQEALEIAQESVQVHRQLVREREGEFEADLAKSLRRLSKRQNQLGFWKEALTSRRESEAIYKKLGDPLPELESVLQEVGLQSGVRDCVGQLIKMIKILRRSNGIRDTSKEINDLQAQLRSLTDRLVGPLTNAYMAEMFEKRTTSFVRTVSAALQGVQTGFRKQKDLPYYLCKNLGPALAIFSGAGRSNPLKRIEIMEPLFRDFDLTGKVKFGKDEVGAGGFSTVYLGHVDIEDKSTLVAIKVLRTEGRPNPDFLKKIRQKFYKEVSVWYSLRHQNIVPFTGFTRDKEGMFPALVSPWLPNGNVISYLEKNPEANRYQLLRDVALGLQFLHSKDFVHADIKGENVLVDAEGRALLCDFGLSKFVDASMNVTDEPPRSSGSHLALPSNTFTDGRTGASRRSNYTCRSCISVATESSGSGTERYMSPELLWDAVQSKMGDIWAFGCVAIRILKGRLPYAELNDFQDISDATLKGTPPIQLELDGMSPTERALWSEIGKCWRLKPEERPDATAIVKAIPV